MVPGRVVLWFLAADLPSHGGRSDRSNAGELMQEATVILY